MNAPFSLPEGWRLRQGALGRLVLQKLIVFSGESPSGICQEWRDAGVTDITQNLPQGTSSTAACDVKSNAA